MKNNIFCLFDKSPEEGWYELTYEYNNKTWGIRLWAENHDKAEERLKAIRDSGKILGKICN